MDPELLSAFTDEAESMLQSIRGGILVFVQDGQSQNELGTPLRAVQSLKGAAAQFGLQEIASTAQLLEDRIRSFIVSREPVPHNNSHELLDLLARIEASIGTIHLGSDSFSDDMSDLFEESFDILQIDSSPEIVQSEPESFESPADDDFEIDAEMLEIFAMEADDLLKNIDTSLDILAKTPDDRDALWEIRRNAHTFKGAAGIVGLKKPSELAHRIEDLLDHLAENEIGPDERIFTILLASTDCLKAITAGEHSPQLAARVTRVYEDFDKVFFDLKNKVEMPVEIAVEPAFIAPSAILEPVLAEIGLEVAAKATPPRSIVRVSLERLDEMVKIVHDLVVSRSVFEQRLVEFDQQIGELQNSTRRLQSANTKLEMDFEASMLGSGQNRQDNMALSPNASRLPYSAADFDPLEFDRYTEFHESTRELSETTRDTFAINTALDAVKGNLESLFEQQRRLIEDMQEKLMRIRMVEFGTLATRLQRAVQVTCEEEFKRAVVTIENQHIEIDTHILDSLIEPLMHLLRNAVVHGIEASDTRRLLGKPETGTIKIRLVNEETHIVLQISDDGRGIAAASLKEKAYLTGLITREAADTMADEEVFELMFVTGLTTAEKLNLSAGRGVGMSIVRESIEARQGTICIDSIPQKGTMFTIRVPLPIAVTNVLIVKANRHLFALPVKLIKHIGEFASSDIKQNGSDRILDLSSGKFPLKNLAAYVGTTNGDQHAGEQINALLLETSETTCALMVDEILKSEEVVIRPLGKPLENLRGVIGAAILGSGDIVPILDMPFLLKNGSKKRAELETPPPEPEKMRIMIVDDSPSVRHMTSKAVENAGWLAFTAKDGVEAMEMLQSGENLPALILTDVEMPRMDGYELAASLQRSEEFRSIPVIMITSRSADKHREKALENGVSQYLTKPYEDKELIKCFRRVTSGFHLEP
ncbi:MAG: response regulator [Saprospiraceae bacterium]|nr:response regulator [Pyrinomonadaceae bacterium]